MARDVAVRTGLSRSSFGARGFVGFLSSSPRVLVDPHESSVSSVMEPPRDVWHPRGSAPLLVLAPDEKRRKSGSRAPFLARLRL